MVGKIIFMLAYACVRLPTLAQACAWDAAQGGASGNARTRFTHKSIIIAGRSWKSKGNNCPQLVPPILRPLALAKMHSNVGSFCGFAGSAKYTKDRNRVAPINSGCKRRIALDYGPAEAFDDANVENNRGGKFD